MDAHVSYVFVCRLRFISCVRKRERRKDARKSAPGRWEKALRWMKKLDTWAGRRKEKRNSHTTKVHFRDEGRKRTNHTYVQSNNPRRRSGSMCALFSLCYCTELECANSLSLSSVWKRSENADLTCKRTRRRFFAKLCWAVRRISPASAKFCRAGRGSISLFCWTTHSLLLIGAQRFYDVAVFQRPLLTSPGRFSSLSKSRLQLSKKYYIVY